MKQIFVGSQPFKLHASVLHRFGLLPRKIKTYFILTFQSRLLFLLILLLFLLHSSFNIWFLFYNHNRQLFSLSSGYKMDRNLKRSLTQLSRSWVCLYFYLGCLNFINFIFQARLPGAFAFTDACLLPLSLSASFSGHNVCIHIFTVSRRELFCSQMLDASTKPEANLGVCLIFPAFSLKFFNWRMIALQYCIGFCHISTWISHRHTYIYFPSFLHSFLSFKFNTLSRMCLCLLSWISISGVHSVSESLNSVLPSH